MNSLNKQVSGTCGASKGISLANRVRAAAVALVLTAGCGSALAATLYVDQRFGPGGNGSTNAPYNTIQAAINDGRSTDVIVYPGTYRENLSVQKSIRIVGYDGPRTTVIDGSAGGNAITIAANMTVTIQGLTISSGTYGVFQPTAGTLYLQNCIFCGNRSHGVYLDRTSTSLFPTVFIYNCISVSNNGSGIYLNAAWNGNYFYPTVIIYNTILAGNMAYGLEARYSGFTSGSITLDYNDYVANALGNYSALFGPGKPITAGSHSFSLNPDFVGGSAYTCNQDYRLSPGSPCLNTGALGVGWLNPDGTRNDIGAYGGPGAARFFTNPNGLPIISNVTIDQGMVPKGSTFTIRAKGAVH
jgi:hypothetical protein